MKALTVRQPWAGCIAHLDKRVENRARRLPGKYVDATVAIHSAAEVDKTEVLSIPAGTKFPSLFANNAEWDAWRFWHLGRKPRDTANWPPKLALGAVVAVARLAGCHHWDWDNLCGPECRDSSPSTPGLCSPWVHLGVPWHWQLADVRPLPEPVPCKGMLGLWRLPEDVERAVTGQLDVLMPIRSAG